MSDEKTHAFLEDDGGSFESRWSRPASSGQNSLDISDFRMNQDDEEFVAPSRPRRMGNVPLVKNTAKPVAMRPGSKKVKPEDDEGPLFAGLASKKSAFAISDIDSKEEEVLRGIGIKEKSQMRKSILTDEINAVPELKSGKGKHAPVETKIIKKSGDRKDRGNPFLKFSVRVLPVVLVGSLAFAIIMGILYVIYKVTG